MMLISVAPLHKIETHAARLAKAVACVASSVLVLITLMAAPLKAGIFTWSGTVSNEVNNAANWGGTGPANVANLSENADWQLPDTLAGGASYNVNLTASTGAWFVGGSSGGGVTFLGGGATPTAYTLTGGDAGNILTVAGGTTLVSTTNRGIITNNSTQQQTFDLDVFNWQSRVDAKNGNIEFKAGRTFSTGGTGAITNGTIRNQHATEFQGDKTIFLNSTVVATTSSTSNRGAIVYNGADTVPTADSMLVLGDIGTGFGARVMVQSANGGVVRAISNNSFGANDGATGSALLGTQIGLTSAFSNGTVELDGTAGNLTIGENFRLVMRTTANGASHFRNVAGTNVINGFVSLNMAGESGADSAYFESAAGKLTFAGGISGDRPNQTNTAFFKGNGAIDLGGLDGIFAEATAGAIVNIDKSGSGTMTTLAGTTNKYFGTTAIHGGSFIVNGAHTTATAGAYTVDSAGTIGGSGLIAAAVNLAGTIAPGAAASVGTLTIGGLTPTNGILGFQLDATNHAAGSGINDLIVVSGSNALNLTGGATLNVVGIGGNLSVGDYDLIQFVGTPTGTAANVALGSIPLAAGTFASIVIDSDSVNLHVEAVPEPAAIVLAMLGLIGFASRRCRRIKM